MEHAPYEVMLQRLLRAIKSDKLADLAKALGISNQSVSQAKKKQQIPVQWIFDIAMNYGVSADWLMTGEGSMLRDEGTALSKKTGRWPLETSWSPPVRIKPSEENDPWKTAQWQEVPLVGLGSCGPIDWYTPESLALRVKLPVEYPYTPFMFAILAIGTSMQPEGIRQGYVVFCNPSASIEAGDAVYVERNDNIAAIKKFLKIDNGRLYLQGWAAPEQDGSQQPYFEDISMTEVKRLTCVVIVRRKA